MINELFRKVTWRDVFDFVIMLGIMFMVVFAFHEEYYGVIGAAIGIMVYNTTYMERRIRELEKRLDN